MSYTPTLLISKNDLRDSELKIYELQSEAKEKNKGAGKWYIRLQALTELEGFLKNEGTPWRDEHIVLEQPEMSWLNEAVRDMMDEIGIYFTTYN